MTEFLALVLFVWVVWLTIRTRYAGETNVGLRDLAARLKFLEQELAKLRSLISGA